MFIDSIQFLQGKLEDLTKDVLRDDCDWKYTHEAVTHEPRLARFMRMKLPFPYTYFDSEEKLKVEKLPDIEEFYDTLRDEECSEEDYEIVKEIWSIVGDFRALHDVYLAFDVLQLCDVFEKFRNETRSQFELDPIHYYTLPVSILSFKACGGEEGDRNNIPHISFFSLSELLVGCDVAAHESEIGTTLRQNEIRFLRSEFARRYLSSQFASQRGQQPVPRRRKLGSLTGDKIPRAIRCEQSVRALLTRLSTS